MGKFIVKEDSQTYMPYLKAVNGGIIATGKRYMSKSACLKGISSIIQNAEKAGIADFSEENAIKIVTNPKFEVYLNDDERYIFILKAKNGETVLYSGEYKSHLGCLKGIESVRKNCSSQPEVVYVRDSDDD